MASHVSHVGVHDHGFNNVSTYGTLWRLLPRGGWRTTAGNHSASWPSRSRGGAGARWTEARAEPDGAPSAPRGSAGYIYSFNGPHSLFADTMRTLRSLAVAHQLGARPDGERDRPISLLGRLLTHAQTNARYNVYFGEGRDVYDLPALRGRVAHESVFNVLDGTSPLPSSQQGYSPFSTWTGGTPGASWATPSSWSTWRPSRTPTWSRSGPGGRGGGLRRAASPWPTSTWPRPPWTGSPTGTPGRRGWPAWGTTWPARPTPSTRPSRWIPPRGDQGGGCCAWGTTSAGGGTGAGAPLPGRARSPWWGRCSTSRTWRSTPSTRGSCCTASTTAPTAGTTCPRRQRAPGRVVDVGLPRPRAGPAAPARGAREPYPTFFDPAPGSAGAGGAPVSLVKLPTLRTPGQFNEKMRALGIDLQADEAPQTGPEAPLNRPGLRRPAEGAPDREPLVHAAHGGLGRDDHGGRHGADAPALGALRPQRGQADLGGRGDGGAPGRAGQPQPADPQRGERPRDRRLRQALVAATRGPSGGATTSWWASS